MDESAPEITWARTLRNMILHIEVNSSPLRELGHQVYTPHGRWSSCKIDQTQAWHSGDWSTRSDNQIPVSSDQKARASFLSPQAAGE